MNYIFCCVEFGNKLCQLVFECFLRSYIVYFNLPNQ